MNYQAYLKRITYEHGLSRDLLIDVQCSLKKKGKETHGKEDLERQAISSLVFRGISLSEKYSEEIHEIARFVIFLIFSKNKDKRNGFLQKRISEIQDFILDLVRSNDPNVIRFSLHLYNAFLLEVMDYDVDEGFTNTLIRQLITNLHIRRLQMVCADFIGYVFAVRGGSFVSRKNENYLYSCCVSNLISSKNEGKYNCPSVLLLLANLPVRINRFENDQLYYSNVQKRIKRSYENSAGFEKYLWYKAMQHSDPLKHWEKDTQLKVLKEEILNTDDYLKECTYGVYRLRYFMDPIILLHSLFQMEFMCYAKIICHAALPNVFLNRYLIKSFGCYTNKGETFETNVDSADVKCDREEKRISISIDYEGKSYTEIKNFAKQRIKKAYIISENEEGQRAAIDLSEVRLELLEPKFLVSVPRQ